MKLSLTQSAIETILASVETGVAPDDAILELKKLRTEVNAVLVDSAVARVEAIKAEDAKSDESSSSEEYYESSSDAE